MSLKPYIKRIINYSKECSSCYNFQVKNNHTNLPIMGYADIKYDNKIIDMKFTKKFQQSYVYQLLFYYNNMYPKWDIKPELEVIHLFTGIKTVHGLLGFSRTGQITITQTVPLKLTLLGLEYRMSVGE